MAWRYWGKADPNYPYGDQQWHPLIWHSLDVAAVADALLEQRPWLLKQLARCAGMDTESVLRLMVLLIGLHDLGKFADNFQRKRCDLYALAFPDRVHMALDSSVRHDQLGWTLWCSGPADAPRQMLKQRLLQWDDVQIKNIMAASCGHHGLPPVKGDTQSLGQAMCSAARADALDFAQRWIEFIWPIELGSIETPCADPERLQWLLAGIAVWCDWLGSNTQWFAYKPAPADPAADWTSYWNYAQQRAQLALTQSHALMMPAAPYAGPGNVLQSGRDPRPMQQAVIELPLGQGPQLIIIEDSTGAGKTEAALLLAHRMFDAGLAEGLYFGLPTQATANSLFVRLQTIAPALLRTPDLTSLVLAHGASGLNPMFRQLLRQAGNTGTEAVRDEHDTASMGLAAWLAESRKRALLAQIGVGTLDQALLAALRSKHNALRLLGLVGKLLIVDEVHAYDAYMLRVLRKVLEIHASLGGSTVLLSATLPISTRSDLLDVYWKVLKKPAPRRGPQLTMPQRSELQQPAQYPLLTALSDHGVTEQPVSRMPASCRSVPIRYLSATAQVDDAALHAASSGQCVAWIHNTVAAAQASFQRLQQRIADSGAQIELVLFHARFALCDRLRIEDRILAGFGPESVATGRQQRIVIATQVIEQSLDLDFDLLISELAPIDLLLQRFGRWRRHPRDAAGNRIEGVDQRTPDAVIVHGPERIADPPGNWLRAWSAGTAMVYANHGQMYLSAKALGAGVELPQQQRELIEAVYGEAASETIPAELAKASEQAEGEQMAQQSVAAINVIDFANGYQRDRNAWPDDLRAQTRLGEPNIDVALARCTASGIEPWAAADPHDPSDYLRWAMSVVKVRADQLCARAPLSDPVLEAAAVLLETESPFLRWRVLLPLIQQPDGRWRAAGLRQLRQNAPSSVLYDYSADSGLVRIKGEA